MAREPLVLLPGLLLDERLFAAQIEALADIAAPLPVVLDREDSIDAMAARVLAEAPERFALCGLSMGGYVALGIVRRAPERVTRLALLDTRAEPDDEAGRARRLALIERAEREGLDAVLDDLLPLFVHADAFARLEPELRRMAHRIGPEAFVRQQRAIMGRPDQRPHLGAIRCPTLVLCGRQDALTPVACHEAMAAAIPDATLVVLPRCGHLAPLERPELTTPQLRLWLERPAAD